MEFLSIVKEAEEREYIDSVFAIERAQEILYELNLMVESNLLKELGLVDSPLAKRATEILLNMKILRQMPRDY